jgi:hypothetical protein
MGGWGVRSLENDEALDWISGLEAVPDGAAVVEALSAVLDDGAFVGAPDGAVAVVAAELVAAGIARPVSGTDGARISALAARISGLEREQDLARRALAAVADPARSELHEQRHGGEDGLAWDATIRDLGERLAPR